MSGIREDVAEFFYREAALLDNRRLDEWLELLDDNLVYRMPLRVTLDKASGEDIVESMTFLDETKGSIRTRVNRLNTTSAWAEDPPSRTRHMITNVLIEEEREKEVVAVSYFLLLRSRRDKTAEQLFGTRRDVLVKRGNGWRIKERTVYPDESVLHLPNLTTFI
ncbi:aromatic-ring-hydroxylating dioxygenase subunit beta [Alicyclobacillus sp. SO9]|uniref:aromatic-ring-hydroxylating dioxygenase subunit beta n=1 Tax=Alicyclobacillus sp. SO9 TaxID=2665646 RepID=UPI0018E8657E|nr:aromatic-ring-hydroxylating dioxygenase subunit beta [Alicyclobacillus sp. SO9]QQE77728.1 aromatic-ring-hydroxylating dioxygenase subunit beta [Alicyclobacillus sp. SO9]